MKTHIYNILLFTLFVGMNVAWGQNYDFSAVCSTGQTLYYKITDNNKHLVKLKCPGLESWEDFQKPTGDIVIPETVEFDGITYSVTEIGSCAFRECDGLTGSLNIPNSVTSIGRFAFQFCSGFTSLSNIGNNVTTIGDCAFDACEGFRGPLIIPNSVVEIGHDAFYECYGFTGPLIIPNSVTTIKDSAFAECSGFSGTLTIGSSVTEIGGWAFRWCRGFSSIISKAVTPPEAGLQPFDGLSTSKLIQVPCGSIEAYRQAYQWCYFTNYHEIRLYEINLFSADETMGTVAITQMPDCEMGICTVKASPKPGYQFDYWMEDGTQVSTEAEYTFEATTDRTLTAYFSNVTNVNSFDESEIQLFPNPTNDVLNVVCEGMRRITIMNAIGQVVYDAEPAGDNSAQISLADYEAGVYVVRITTDCGMINRQVVKVGL